jgi:hypothetical protein
LRAVAIAWENRGVWAAEGCSRPWEDLLFTMHINIELRREIREWNHDDYCCWSNGLNEEELYVQIFFCMVGRGWGATRRRGLHVHMKKRNEIS